MQNAWLARAANPQFARADVVQRINHAAASIRRDGGRVIFIRHADEEAPAGSPAWNIIPALHVSAADAAVDKLACDAFAGTDLAHILAAHEAGTVYICGFATEFCVDTTVRAAVSRALQVVVLGDAHTTSDRSHLDAQAIITHHNWVWANMAVPAGSSLEVTTTTQAFPG